LNDVVEARAMNRVFSERAGVLPCSSTKPVTGHCLGATPALEAILCVETLRRGRIVPTANCEELDPECAIHPVAGGALDRSVAVALSNSLGFWGYHASLVFTQP
jgi:3-oxoacyl-[acyl-carrier-protein] synthase II